MAVDQAGIREGVPERFVPKDMRGQLIEAEHLSRYRWAARAAAGKRVLDAGCGTAYGTAMMAEAGAHGAVGVDIAETVLESVRGEMPEAVELRVGDLTALDLEDDQFDLIVCFEVIEHFEDPDSVLDELARVLAPGGALLVSSPNRGVYPPDNPHHLHEFAPEELTDALRTRFTAVELLRQQDFVTSAILSTPLLEASPQEPLPELPLYKLVSSAESTELYTIAVAGNGDLPALPPLAMMASELAIGQWASNSEDQEKELQNHRRYIQELETKIVEQGLLEAQLLEVEQRLVQLPEMERKLERLEPLEGDLRARLETAHAELEAIQSSFSWRITRPLRDAKAYLPGRSNRR